MSSFIESHRSRRKLTTMVENQTVYSAEFSQLSIFETHKIAEKVQLKFDFPIIASMLTGKKIMHLNEIPSFDFFPGESVVMPTNEEMIIDFPIAKFEEPTQCLALGIDGDKILEVAQKFNFITSIEEENNNWELDKEAAHLMNNQDINILIKRLVTTFVDSKKSKDVLLDLMIQELIVRLLQTKAKQRILIDPTGVFSDTRIGTVIKYIKQNLTNQDLNVNAMANKAYMSTSHFYKKFKNTLGVSPIDYLNSEKIKFAKKLMRKNRKMLISEIAFQSGFNNISYFNRQFKKLEMITPQQFKKSIIKK